MSKNTTNQSDNNPQVQLFSLSSIESHKIVVSYTSPDTSSYGGLLLLREVESRSSVIKSLSQCLTDSRHEGYVRHTYHQMLTQRIMQIACGYEDADDCDLLRRDSVFKMCAGRTPASHDLASQPTMSRLENTASVSELYKMACSFLLLFIYSYDSPPKTIILDVDDSNFNTYGNQQYTLFNNYYDDYCYMPFFLFEGLSGKLILPLLRPGRRSKDLNIFGLLRRVIEMLRGYWKKTLIVIRGDSHFCCDKLMKYCEAGQRLYYITGIIGFKPLQKEVALWVEEAKARYKRYGEAVRIYRSFSYGAVAWKKKRRVIAAISINEEGLNVRYIITNFSTESSSRHLYEQVYAQRGTMELYIKEIKCHLKGHKMSCSRFSANQFRLFLHGAAYILIHALKTNVLAHTAFAGASMVTIREKFLLVAVQIKEYKTRIKVELPVNYPYKEEFTGCLQIFEALRLTG